MADIVPPSKRSEMMSGIRGKNTKPEIQVRKLLHASGYRFRLHRKDLPGKPDITLSKFDLVIFVNGCFWHGHSDCSLFRIPKSRQEFWEEKIQRNIDRDTLKTKALLELGWRVGVVWECALKGKNAIPATNLLTYLSENIESNVNTFDIRGAPRSPKL